MKLSSFVIAVAATVMLASCASKTIEKTDNGVSVLITQDAIAHMVTLSVYGQDILGASTSGNMLQIRQPDFLPSGAEGTPFDTRITDTEVAVTTSMAGISVNRQTSEITFTDSLGNVLLTVVPGEINPNDVERAIKNELGTYKIIFSQADTVMPDSVDNAGTIKDLPLPLDSVAGTKIVTDGYNILWQNSFNGSKEQFFIVFGEQVNRFGSLIPD